MKSLVKTALLLLLTLVLLLPATGACAQFRRGGSVVFDSGPADSIPLEQTRRLFRRDAGTPYSIEFERSGNLHQTTLTLKKVI